MAIRGLNKIWDERPGEGDLTPKLQRDIRDTYIAQQEDLSALSPLDQWLAVEYRRLERFAQEQARADRATGARSTDWEQWLIDAREKARQKAREKFGREKEQEAASETAKQAVDNYKMPDYLKRKFRL